MKNTLLFISIVLLMNILQAQELYVYQTNTEKNFIFCLKLKKLRL